MNIYLAATSGLKKSFVNGEINPKGLFLLESYVSIRDWQIAMIPKLGSFLLDSGAFTFMQNTKKHGSTDWNKFADEYADFVRNHNIKHYMELDIDSIVDLKRVEELRNRIEIRVGWQSIPVWHKNRGKEYFLNTVKEYKYVAIGGIVTREIPYNIYQKMFPWFIKEAHKNGSKIHGLGYTSPIGLPQYHFDSVDSTTWLNGNQYGELHFFNGETIKRYASVVGGVKTRNIKDDIDIVLHNFKEWVKFQKYAQQNL